MIWRREMKKTLLRTTLRIAVLFVIVPMLLATPQFALSITHPSPVLQKIQEPVDMLIFVSPQYASDAEIATSISSYISAIKDDLGWNARTIFLKKENNDFRKIDQIIEAYYEIYKIKACMMVGEDTDTALGGDYDYMEKPSTIPWSTTGGEDKYEVSEQGVVCKPYAMDICISLLYPTHNLDYQTKKTHIIFAFEKFSTQRNISCSKEVMIFESSDINTYSKDLYHQLEAYGNVYYSEDPTDEEIGISLSGSYAMYYVHGHSNPSGTMINADGNGWFSADMVDELDTPFFGADGCYVSGWWSDQSDTDTLNPSIDCLWYGSTIFTSKHVQTMVLGLLSQNGLSYPVSFIENALPELLEGKTLAESMIGDVYLSGDVVFGDPTFHYTI